MESKGLNPIQEIIKLIPALDPKEQVRAWEYIHGFVDARPKEMPSAEEEEFDNALDELTTDELVKLATREQ